MRFHPSVLSLLLFLCVFVSLGELSAQPNVVLVMTDDQGYGDLSCHGNPDIATPNLDRLHDQSVRFTNFHVDPTCAPTRAALITGRYSLSTGVWHTIAGRSFLHPEEVTLGDVFSANGYNTGMFGKWHLGDNYPCRPQDRGFKETVFHGGGGIGQTPDLWGNDYFDDRYWHNGKPQKYKGYCTDVFFNEAMRFIKQSKNTPFFAYLLPNAPHGPYYVDKKYSKPFLNKGFSENRANFYGMLVNIDENMGRLMDFLDKTGRAENTILIFMTDNGTAGPWYPKEGKDFTAGLRGIKGSIYEGGHRVPFFVRWPSSGITGGRDVDLLAAHIDVLPTLVDLCGLAKPVGPDTHGASLAPLLNADGRKPKWPDRALVVNNQRIAIPKKYKDFAVMTDRWRLINKDELYDLENDRGQESNVAAKNPKVIAKLMDHYEKWWDLSSDRADQLVPITVGADQGNPAHLTAHDWHTDKIPWHQEVVAEAPNFNGPWEIDVTRPGSYRITLRERPADAKFPIAATQAELHINGHKEKKPIPEGATSVSFTVDLKRGRTQVQSILTNKDNTTRGAYYAEIKRL
jgi:arylsulfatase A-like enzyme